MAVVTAPAIAIASIGRWEASHPSDEFAKIAFPIVERVWPLMKYADFLVTNDENHRFSCLSLDHPSDE